MMMIKSQNYDRHIKLKLWYEKVQKMTKSQNCDMKKESFIS